MAQKHNQYETQNAPMTRLGDLKLYAQQRIIRGTAFLSTSFAADNPILQLGELGYETDTNKLKIGDGVTAWNDLAYAGGGSDTSASLAQFDTMPTASADNLGAIVQYVGETDANYTNGYIYQCTGAGEPVVYSWTQIDVQPAPSGLPDQTGQSGKFLTTDGTDASWATINALTNNATAVNALSILGESNSSNISAISIGVGSSAKGSSSICIGYGTTITYGNANYTTCIGPLCNASGSQSVVIGYYASSDKVSGIAIGNFVKANATKAIQLGCGASSFSPYVNSDANTFKVANANGNFEIMSADGTIPAARHASLPSADGTYVLKLVISGGVPTLSWVAE